MKFSKNVTNKIISYVDRNFTYDYRTMRREEENSLFDFYAYRSGATVVIDRCPTGLYISIKKDNRYICKNIAKSFAEIKNFKHMILCLG